MTRIAPVRSVSKTNKQHLDGQLANRDHLSLLGLPWSMRRRRSDANLLVPHRCVALILACAINSSCEMRVGKGSWLFQPVWSMCNETIPRPEQRFFGLRCLLRSGPSGPLKNLFRNISPLAMTLANSANKLLSLSLANTGNK